MVLVAFLKRSKTNLNSGFKGHKFEAFLREMQRVAMALQLPRAAIPGTNKANPSRNCAPQYGVGLYLARGARVSFLREDVWSSVAEVFSEDDWPEKEVQ